MCATRTASLLYELQRSHLARSITSHIVLYIRELAPLTVRRRSHNMSIMRRRQFLSQMGAAGALVAASSKDSGAQVKTGTSNRARVIADPARTVASLDRRLFGSFVEHIGRCIYGGIYEPGS